MSAAALVQRLRQRGQAVTLATGPDRPEGQVSSGVVANMVSTKTEVRSVVSGTVSAIPLGPGTLPSGMQAVHEVDTFTARLARFTDRGLSLSDAEALADRLLARDRDGDGRRTCTECHHLAGHTAGRWHCNNWRAAGVAIRAPALLPADLVRQLQRCDGFTDQHQHQAASS